LRGRSVIVYHCKFAKIILKYQKELSSKWPVLRIIDEIIPKNPQNRPF
jgi:hypothetical protein